MKLKLARQEQEKLIIIIDQLLEFENMSFVFNDKIDFHFLKKLQSKIGVSK